MSKLRPVLLRLTFNNALAPSESFFLPNSRSHHTHVRIALRKSRLLFIHHDDCGRRPLVKKAEAPLHCHSTRSTSKLLSLSQMLESLDIVSRISSCVLPSPRASVAALCRVPSRRLSFLHAKCVSPLTGRRILILAPLIPGPGTVPAYLSLPLLTNAVFHVGLYTHTF